jgi:hypothetical protein
MDMRSGLFLVVLGFVSACDDDDDDDGGKSPSESGTPDDDSTGGDGSGGGMNPEDPEPECMNDADCDSGMMCSGGQCMDTYWVVGGDGAVIRVAADGAALPHPALPTDMAAIECVGATEAWAVGDAGMMVQTTDAGASWHVVATGTSAALRDVEGDHAATVTAVGDDGTWIVLRDGATWPIVGATGDLEGVAMGGSGLLAVGRDGAVWSAEPEAAIAVQVAALDGPARAIDLAHDAGTAVAVGDAGALWWSTDGVAWTRREIGRTADLHGVQVARDGRAAIAVGDGIVVHIDADGVRALDLGDAALRDIHLDSNGAGAAVGLDGVIASTTDGEAFTVLRIGDADLFGVDALGSVHW